eukprot:g2999.t1
MFLSILGLASARRAAVKTHALFGGGGRNKEQEKEEMFRRQQEIILERRSKSNKSIRAAQERRKKLSAEIRAMEERKHLAREAMSRGEMPHSNSYQLMDSDEDSDFEMPWTHFGSSKHNKSERLSSNSSHGGEETEKAPLQWIRGIFGGNKKTPTTNEED